MKDNPNERLPIKTFNNIIQNWGKFWILIAMPKYLKSDKKETITLNLDFYYWCFDFLKKNSGYKENLFHLLILSHYLNLIFYFLLFRI